MNNASFVIILTDSFPFKREIKQQYLIDIGIGWGRKHVQCVSDTPSVCVCIHNQASAQLMTTYCSVGVFQISRKAFNATNHRNLYHPNNVLLRKSASFLYLYVILVSWNFSRMPKIFGVCKKKKKKQRVISMLSEFGTHAHIRIARVIFITYAVFIL